MILVPYYHIAVQKMVMYHQLKQPETQSGQTQGLPLRCENTFSII